MKLPEKIKTKLENAAKEGIAQLLDEKIVEYQERNLPVEEKLADYIALVMQNIDEEVEKLKNYKKLLDEKIKELQIKKREISEEVADYLENNLGVEKLHGLIVSSITIKPEKESKTKKFVLDAEKDELIKQGLAHYEIVKKLNPKQIKINKKRNGNGGNIKHLPQAE